MFQIYLHSIKFVVLSNGLETKLGAFMQPYDYFFEWLKVDSEKEILDREAIHSAENVKR